MDGYLTSPGQSFLDRVLLVAPPSAAFFARKKLIYRAATKNKEVVLLCNVAQDQYHGSFLSVSLYLCLFSISKIRNFMVFVREDMMVGGLN